MKAKISLLVPSRERLNLKLTLISSIITSASDINNIELIFGIDEDDPTRDIVYKIADSIPFVKVIDIQNDKKFIGINKIWNLLYPHAEGDVLGYIGDDMIFKTPNWDEEILKEFNEENLPEDKIKLVHCFDGQRTRDEICVNAFVHKKYTEVVGYLCREEFLINWSDQWLYQSFKSFDRVKWRSDIHIHHNHWVYGDRKKDTVADRMLSDNHGSISDTLWVKLASERRKEVKKLSDYLGMKPVVNYDSVCNYRLDKDSGIITNDDVKDTFFVICNGPSLRGFDFNKIKGYDSIGMNAAYRMFERIDYWPTYFSCGDLNVGMSHKDEFARLIKEQESIFFLRQNVTSNIKASGVVNEEDLKKMFEISCMRGKLGEFDTASRRLNIIEPGCTGQLSAMIGVALGFKKIVLLGADCNYDETVPGFKSTGSGGGLVLDDEKYTSPDHWFDDYLQKGDVCTVPNVARTHMGGWRQFSDIAKANNIEVINCSMVSKIPFFQKIEFEDLKL
jgi:hypothetical protein